jgi:hypothetical protein
VILDAGVTQALAAEGLARDVVRAVPLGRRNAGLEVSDRMSLQLSGYEAVRAAVEAHAELIKKETLATNLDFADSLDRPTTAVVGDHQRWRWPSARPKYGDRQTGRPPRSLRISTGADILRWLEANPLRADQRRTAEEIDAYLATERASWE